MHPMDAFRWARAVALVTGPLAATVAVTAACLIPVLDPARRP